MLAGIGPGVSFLEGFDGEPGAPKLVNVRRPTRPRMVNRRATFLAGGDERGKRPSEAPIERLFRAVGQARTVIFRMSGIGGLHRIARKLGDDASARRRQAEAARDEASGAGKVDGLMVVLPRVRPCEKRQGFFVRATSGDTRMCAMASVHRNSSFIPPALRALAGFSCLRGGTGLFGVRRRP
jgi:hypothetical protein